MEMDDVTDSGGYPGPEIDMERFVARLRRVLGGPKNFAFDADFRYQRGALFKTLRYIQWKLGA